MVDVRQLEADLIARRAEYERHESELGVQLNRLGGEIAKHEEAVGQAENAGVREKRVVDVSVEKKAIRELEDQRDSIKKQMEKTRGLITNLTREGAELPSQHRAEWVAIAFEAGAVALESARAAAAAVRKAEADAASANRQMAKALRTVTDDPRGVQPFVEIPPAPGRVPELLDVAGAIAQLEAYSGYGSHHVSEEFLEQQLAREPGTYRTPGPRPDTRHIGPAEIQRRDDIAVDEFGFAERHYVGPLPEGFEEAWSDGRPRVGTYTPDGQHPQPLSPREREIAENWRTERTTWNPQP